MSITDWLMSSTSRKSAKKEDSLSKTTKAKYNNLLPNKAQYKPSKPLFNYLNKNLPSCSSALTKATPITPDYSAKYRLKNHCGNNSVNISLGTFRPEIASSSN